MTNRHREQPDRRRPKTPTVSPDVSSVGELPRSSTAKPEIHRTIIKLDLRSMVWADDQLTSEVDPAGCAIAGVLATAMLFLIPTLWELSAHSGDFAVRLVTGIFGLSLLALVVVGIGYFLKTGISNGYSDFHFNRRTRQVYTSRGAKLWCLDWNRIRPSAYQIPDPRFPKSGRSSWGLELVEYDATNPKVWRQRCGVQAMLPDRDACQRVWEAIRCYMEEAPEQLPRFEVTPSGHGWQSALLEFGPMNDPSLFSTDTPRAMVRLLQGHWWPVFLPDRWLFWGVWWPGTLLTILYARYRPRARFPANWIADETPLPNETNPYRSAVPSPYDQANRRKAAAIVGLVSFSCIAVGAAFTTAVIWWLVLPALSGIWHDAFGTLALGGHLPALHRSQR